MKTATWKELVELVGIAAIVASLIFVGLQLKQAQEIAVASQYQERATNLVDWATANLQSAESLRLRGEWLKTLPTGDDITEEARKFLNEQSAEELGRMWFTFASISSIAENNHYQYQSGFLNQESWEAIRYRLKLEMSNPIHRQFYSAGRPAYRASFQSLIDQLIAEIDAESQ